jgi:cytochrome oxidase Cu insertion factor (SCO1/SenC/PrrC family)
MRKYAFVLVFAIVAVLACNRAGAVNELPAVGTAAPSFNLVNNEGKQVSLADYKGKWVVLYFYRLKRVTFNAISRSTMQPML